MKRSKYLDIILSNKEEKKPEKTSTVSDKLLKRILIRFGMMFSIKLFVLTIYLVIFLLPVFLILGFLAGLSGGDSQLDESYNISGDSFLGNFSEDNLDIPLGIPLERGYITYGYDYNKYKSSFVNAFLKIFYSNAREYYSGHSGIDFGRIYKDKQDGYNPYILSTLRGVVKRVETRTEVDEGLKYNKKIYKNGNISSSSTTIKDSKEVEYKPYGNHIVIGSLDGEFYVMYAHLSSINNNIVNSSDKIGRGNILGRMGTTGNSTGIHLHYEIRYCGEKNPELTKSWGQCKPVNPLGIAINKTSFLGFSELPEVNKFIAGAVNVIKDKVIKEEEVEDDINSAYNDFCSGSDVFFTGKNITCKEAFPIIYANKYNSLFPKLNDNLKAEEIGEKYIKEEYSISGIPSLEQINEIREIEGISQKIYTTNELYRIVGNKFSLGKYLNSQKYYSTSLSKDTEDIMYNDTIDTLDYLKKKYKTTEEIYNNYYYNPSYEKGENPYVYNMSNSNNIFMDILDSKGTFISKYSNYGVFTIFKKLK